MSELVPYTVLAEEAQRAPPTAALVLGTGLGQLVQRINVHARTSFADIPGLATTSVVGHRGFMTLGDWAGRRVLLFEGRLHYYEGHPWSDVVRPVVLAHALGARVLLLTNAAGGIHDALGPGSLMAIRDHMEWNRPSCWRDARPGEQPSPYDAGLLDVLNGAGGPALHRGIYAALTGPCYETPAEIRALKAWGADAVGMSTAREAQQGYELGMKVAAVSCVTNKAAGLGAKSLNHEEVLTTAKAAAGRLTDLIEHFLRLT